MTGPIFSTIAPLAAGVLSVWMLAGCGGQATDQSARNVTLLTAAQLNQQDINAFTSTENLGNCSFVISSGQASFTPSNELSQLLYGDPYGNAHQQSFLVPPVGTGGASISVTNLQAEMAGTSLTLDGSTATVKLSFDGMMHASFPAPIIGTISSDVQINSSSISIAFVYDTTTERIQASGVTSHFDVQAKNCGLLGWCNGLVDKLLKLNLVAVGEALLRHGVNKELNNADITARVDDLLVAGYNLKDHEASPWTMVPHSLSLASGAFNFTAQRQGP